MIYSRLAFSYPQDRQIAIAGLEQRLIHNLRVNGGYGILDDDGPGLMRRSLLWCRGSDQDNLKRIRFGDDARLQVAKGVPPPPTWSWMAYEGGIDYLDLPFGRMEWEQNDIIWPWIHSPKGTWHTSGSEASLPGLSAVARGFELGDTTRSDTWLCYDIKTQGDIDTPTRKILPRPGLKCVVLGKMKEQFVRDMTHYVLFVIPKTPQINGEGRLIVERVGVGYMPGSWIHFNQPGDSATIV